MCIVIHKMQNPVHSGLKTSLKEFPDLLLSDECFPKESEKLLQLAFIILILSELNCWPKFQLMMRPIILLLYYLQRMPSVQISPLVNKYYYATPVLTTGGKQDSKDITAFSSFPHTVVFLNSHNVTFY